MRRSKMIPLLAGGAAVMLLSGGLAGAQSAQESVPQTIEVAALPDSPGFVQSHLQEAAQQNAPERQENAPAGQPGTQPAIELVAPSDPFPPATQQSTPAVNRQPVASQRPVGTAAAEAPTVTGVAAAEPTGVAIAPAKQRRARSLVIKVGALIGAGAAVGTVVALTAGTSSKPPGAH